MAAKRKATTGHNLLHRYTGTLEAFDDNECAKRDRFKKGLVDLLRSGVQGDPDEESTEIHVRQDAPIPAPPVQCQQATFPGSESPGFALQEGKYAKPAPCG